MATKKKASGRKTSSGSDPKSKRVVKKKMEGAMHEFKHRELKSGRSGKTVRNPKQAIAIGLSEARRSGADIPPSPNARKSRGKKAATKKASGRKTTTKKTTTKKATTKKAAPRKSTARKTTTKKPSGRKTAARKR